MILIHSKTHIVAHRTNLGKCSDMNIIVRVLQAATLSFLLLQRN